MDHVDAVPMARPVALKAHMARRRHWPLWCAAPLLVALLVEPRVSGTTLQLQMSIPGPMLHPIERPRQVRAADGQLLLREALQYVGVADARAKFSVTGDGLTVAVLDTGLNLEHADFRAAIKASRNFSTDDKGAADRVNDYSGHGTNVTGIIASNGPRRVDPKRSEAANLATHPSGLHQGVAIGSSIVALKVLPSANWVPIEDALQWVQDNHQAHGITVVNMSLQSGENLQDDNAARFQRMRQTIANLTKLRIPVVAAAGNAFAAAQSEQGMSYPAIIRETISVAAVYDADIKSDLPKRYPDWSGFTAFAERVKRGQITPFSQRLATGALQTDLVAPGAVITSTGLNGEFGESEQEGSSQAAPVVSGIILLMQEWYREFQIAAEAGTDKVKAAKIREGAINDPKYRPPVDKLLEWLRATEDVTDNYGDDDNVTNTNATFKRVDAVRAFTAMTRELLKK